MTIKGRILVIDDNENLRMTMERVLKLKGHDVVTTHSSSEAIELAAVNNDIDLVFLNLKLPLMIGIETRRHLKELIPNCVVLMMTGFALEELIQETLENGFYGIINKSIEFEIMLNLIEKARISEQGALVLVVDDSGLSNSFRMLLERKGFSVVVTENSEDAIEAAKSQPYDILFIDTKLPAINGLETYISIKEIRPETVAVLMTGSPKNVNELVEEAIVNTTYSYLHKPLDMVEVFTIVDEILSRKLEVSEWV